jgi:hypothetical protein
LLHKVPNFARVTLSRRNPYGTSDCPRINNRPHKNHTASIKNLIYIIADLHFVPEKLSF